MPRLTPRQKRVERLLRSFIKYRRNRLKRAQRRATHNKHPLQLFSSSSSPSASSEPLDSSPESDWDDLFELGSQDTSESSDNSDSDDGMPDLVSSAGSDSDDEDTQDDLSTESDSGIDADDETDDEMIEGHVPRLSRYVRHTYQSIYTHRYDSPRNNPIPKPPPQLPHVLTVFKTKRPDQFREILRVDPTTFDKIIDKIKDDPIFFNNSNNPQQPVEEQLAIVLFRFGHNGNAASQSSVARWAGGGHGSIGLITKRVMMAVLRDSFMDEAVRFPTPEEKEDAKVWVESHSCKAWRDGWCLVDGTLVPLYDRPHWYGESYFDRKCNYSLNIQIISLPNLCIIDFGYGYTGSTHDSTAWADTCVAQKHETVFEGGEFVWADSAYPLQTWLIAPYKKPDRDLRENEEFNNHVSMVRIRSEHAIGFLKGRFQSLKSLRVRIKDKRTHQFATYWIAACIGLHAFAMQCEAEERAGDDSDNEDPFIREGLSSDADSDGERAPLTQGPITGLRLRRAKARREQLKRRLFREKERRWRQREFDEEIVLDGNIH